MSETDEIKPHFPKGPSGTEARVGAQWEFESWRLPRLCPSCKTDQNSFASNMMRHGSMADHYKIRQSNFTDIPELTADSQICLSSPQKGQWKEAGGRLLDP